MNQAKIIISNIKYEENIEYQRWKQDRMPLISALGPKLFLQSESELQSTFEDIEMMVLELSKSKENSDKMKMLMLISLLHYFQRDIDQIKIIWDPLNELKNENCDVLKATTKVIHWIAKENKEGGVLFKIPVQNAFCWIKEKSNQKYWFSALLILNRAKIFYPYVDITNNVSNVFNGLFNICCGENFEMRVLAVKILTFQFRTLSEYTNKGLFNKAYSKCFNFILKNNSKECHGPMCILKLLFKLQCSCFELNHEFIDVIIRHTKIDYQALSIESFKFLFKVANACKTAFIRKQIIEIVQELIKKCQTPVNPHPYYHILGKFIRIFQADIDTNQLTSFCENQIIMCKSIEHCKYSFCLLSIILEVCSNVKLSSKLFNKVFAFDEYIRFLHHVNPIPQETVNELHKFIDENLTLESSSGNIIWALKFINEFANLLFLSSEDLYEKIHTLKVVNEENVKLYLVKCLSHVDTNEAIHFLVYLAQYDPWPRVRYEALHAINLPKRLALMNDVNQTLSDSSFKVRRYALEVFAEVIKYNPLDFYTEITACVEHVLSSIQSLSNAKIRSKIASLLPVIVTHYSKLLNEFIPNIVMVCLNQLNATKPFPISQRVNLPSILKVEPFDISSVKYRDNYMDPNSFLFNLNERKINEPKRFLVFKIQNEKYVNSRDGYLLQALACLGSNISPYFDYVLTAFYNVFSSRNSSQLLITAANSFTKIISSISTSFNLRIFCPEFIPALIKHLNPTQGKDVALAIIELLGTACDWLSYSPQSICLVKNDFNELSADLKNPSFFTDFVLSHLLPYLSTPSIYLYETITKIFICSPESAGKFMDKVIPMFLRGIESTKGSAREKLFGELEVIAVKCPIETIQFMPSIIKTLVSHISETSCMRLYASFSYHFMGTFIPYVSYLYLPALNHFDTDDSEYFKYLMKFCTFAVIFQNQPFCQFIDAFETYEIYSDHTKYVANALICLMQSMDLRAYQSRISHLTFKLIKSNKIKSDKIKELIYNLAICTSIPFSVARDYLIIVDCKSSHIKTLEKLMKSNIRNLNDAKFITLRPPKIKLMEKTVFVKSQNQEKHEFFSELEVPNELNMLQWLDNLSSQLIEKSPSSVIRSCTNFASSQSDFRNSLFPIAFLSCYKESTEEDRHKFSNIVSQIIQTHNHVDQTIISLAEIVDRAFIPLYISDYELSSASENRPFSVYLLQREIKKNPSNHKAIEKLLELDKAMGQNSAAISLLNKFSLDRNITAKWYELLGDWVNALYYYEDNDSNLVSRIRCLGHLEQWSSIRELEEKFLKMDPHDRTKSAKYFAWAFYHSGDYSKAEEIISQFTNQLSIKDAIFNAVFNIFTSKYDKAQQIISSGFSMLARSKQSYISGDVNRANLNLSYAKLYVELKEALHMKMNSKNVNDNLIYEFWNKRLKGFKHNSETYIQLIEIRNSVFSSDNNLYVYLKMISVLRNERKWKLIDIYFDKFFSKTYSFNIEYSHCKVFLSLGKFDEARNIIQNIISIMDSISNRNIDLLIKSIPSSFGFLSLLINFNSFKKLLKNEFLKLINSKDIDLENLDQEKTLEMVLILKKLGKKFPDEFIYCINDMIKSFNLERNFKSKMYRTLGTILLSNAHQTSESLTYITNLFLLSQKDNETDYKAWLGWANSNSILHDITQDDKYSFYAVDGFLKSAKIQTSCILEYLCQMFAIFFKIKDSSAIPQNLIDELCSLPSQILKQIIPQTIVHIEHPDLNFRNIVHKILYNYGKEHFQDLFFQINIYKFSKNKEKAKFSQLIIENLSQNHEVEKEDAELFADGMIEAAMTCFEHWKNTLDSGLRAKNSGQIDLMIQILDEQFKKYYKPQNDIDRLFIRLYGNVIGKCYNLFLENTKESFQLMWNNFKELFTSINERISHYDTILLPKVCEKLALKKGFSICIPGMEEKDEKIEYIQSTLQVLNTQQRPRCVTIFGNSGLKVKFLLKGNEDLRLDKRFMQFFSLINSLLNKTKIKREYGASIEEYSIIPLAPNVGLVRWLTGSDTIHQIICEMRNLLEISQTIEYDILTDFCGNMTSMLSYPQKLETYYVINEQTQGNEIKDFLWVRAPNASTWFLHSSLFCITTALMSMIGYVIGLGDRHPSNIMIQRETGKVIHIDFADSFESAINRENFPEKVPFRLTRMIVNAFGGSGGEGTFKNTCEDVMWILRENRRSLVALLEIFINEPLEDVLYEEEYHQSPSNILERVSLKLTGKERIGKNNKEGMSVEKQVDILIMEAIDPANYMKHYSGWCPYW